MNFREILTSDFLFGTDISRLHTSDKALGIIGIALTAAGIIARIFTASSKSPATRKMWLKFFNPLLTTGILELLWFSFRYQNAQVIGNRFFALLILFVGVLWLIPAFKYALGQYRRDAVNWEKQKLKAKYLK